MVDLDWIAWKLIEQERAEKIALWRRKHEFKHTMTITTKFQFNGYNLEITHDFSDVLAYSEWLKDLETKGFTKPVYQNKAQSEIKPDQNGKVVSVAKSAKQTAQGKPMFDVNIALEDGSMVTVLKLNATEFRAGDEVWYFKNSKGYADVQLDFLAKETE